MEDRYLELKKKIKAIQNLDKYSTHKVISWLVRALDTRYPSNRKRAFEILGDKSWDQVRLEIIRLAESQNFDEIHKFKEAMVRTDLFYNEDFMRRGLIIDGTLAIITGSRITFFMFLQKLSEQYRDSKLETYLLYRYFAGKPRLQKGVFEKF